jgi:hypothetical protein
MGYRQSDLQPAFDVSGTYAFRVWGYGTADTLEEVLGPGYMRSGASMLHPGDLIYVRSCPRRDAASGRAVGETRVALIMVVGWERNAMRLRLVQDFGRPEDDLARVPTNGQRPVAPAPTLTAPALSQAPAEAPAPTPAAAAPAVAAPALLQAPAEPAAPVPAPAAPPRRGRGRPPGSRNRKAAFPSFRAGFR